jgi:hypothetical protein
LDYAFVLKISEKLNFSTWKFKYYSHILNCKSPNGTCIN